MLPVAKRKTSPGLEKSDTDSIRTDAQKVTFQHKVLILIYLFSKTKIPIGLKFYQVLEQSGLNSFILLLCFYSCPLLCVSRDTIAGLILRI